MGAPGSLPPGRLAAVGAVVFVANAGLLVLQLVAGRLLAPFVGSSLETWTGVIAAFLAGIALGNAVGGPLADRFPRPRTLAGGLFLGALAALWMLALPQLLTATGVHQSLPLGVRIPTLAALLCLPAGFALSLLTPVAIRLGLADVSRAGRVAGLMFALSTVGCLAGNYLTGFVLVPGLTVNAIVLAVAGSLVLTAAAVVVGFGHGDTVTRWQGDEPPTPALSPCHLVSLSPRHAFSVVFLASFAGMALELAAARMMATVVGVSLYTWTGVIGVMLAGTAAGNWVGGRLADRPSRGRLGLCLVLAALAAVLTLVAHSLLTAVNASATPWVQRVVAGVGLIPTVLLWTFAVFFPPMFALGTVSPQVVRLAVADVAHAGRTAGRVYAVSTLGAIAGTLLTGFVLISAVGMYRTVLLAAALAGLAAVLAGRVWRSGPQLYLLSIAGGGVVGGMVLVGHALRAGGVVAETNYYTIKVTGEETDGGPELTLALDRLVHSKVRPDDPGFIHYQHEHIQMEFLRAAGPAAKALVIGGGGYTFPRAARTELPNSTVDVVEIDPGVTRVAYSHLGLDPALGIRTVNMDGRQFVAERVSHAHVYDLITLDAVNDLSVPAHLLTVECNQAVRRVLAKDGVYLVTVIDAVADGRLWKAVYHTLAETFPHVALLTEQPDLADPDKMPTRAVLVLYAGDRPVDVASLKGQGGDGERFTHVVPPAAVAGWLAKEAKLVLTDQYAPVDNLMAGVFRKR